ncbi:hypothetical protein HZZ00_37485 (plasmid) [Streptomyces sp. NEAU-sy36]|uniref:hypothetical protein n=1 Tax=unclassified Streptomyces TaxID=2593676 RepID=UPI0015D57462|nr:MULTISPECIES: hypothetical protein [unclassified Streptomyces]QLJ06730.1 hypothetical protein HZZ00_37485 [Streptomyces sp. NEAU-sy36]
MRRPAQHRLGSTPAPGWAHPYTGLPGIAVFYNDGGTDPAPLPAPTPADVLPKQPPAADPVKQFTQDDLDRIAAKEKAQGQRAGARQALEDFAKEYGFNTVDDAKAFIDAARKAQQDALSEEEKRRQDLDRREQELAAKEAATVARERAAIRRAAVMGLGATGEDLADALALLDRDLAEQPDADEATVTAAAEALKARRPALFTAAPAAPQALPPAPGGAPAGGGPRPSATKDDVQARARKRAEQMGFRRPDAA